MIHLCFHGVGVPVREREPGESRYWISRELFARVLDEVDGRDDVRLSFDDGNRSDVETALDAVLAHGRTATFFVIAGRLDRPDSLSAGDVRALRDAGMTIGTHGMDHVPWRGLSPADEQRELVDARQVLAEVVGASVDEAAFPLGRYERASLTTLRRLGYRHVFTSDRQPSEPGSWLQHRFSLRSDDTLEGLRAEVLTTQPRPRLAFGRIKTAVKRLR
ncbi:polysaccharide deacetylase family protein [Microlunatus flavus]|uniref:Polysaccharide deacetylase n=1 Tax=Microlunatus flavus TaxID=1036181 RepID=A0A1H9DI14_9ACTN|nr:polysaccharide deacetylase family protein [Microlunatus flavus]SEQ12413.1 Polysaccharide deacetylase [Microlunatus flavus]